MGSVIDTVRSSPARLGHAGDVAVVCQLAQADPAYAELAIHRAGPAASAAPGVAARLVLRRAPLANGIPSASSSANASSSLWTVVVIVMSRPRTWSTSS